MFKKIVIVKKSTTGGNFAIPPCVGQLTVEAYGNNNLTQCQLVQPGGAGTPATECANAVLSNQGGGNYSRSTINVSTATSIYATYCSSNSGRWYANTATTSIPTTSTQGVLAYDGAVILAGIGQIKYTGGRNGKKYFKNYRFICGGKSGSNSYYGLVFGGYGGQAGPNGNGGNGSSAYPSGSYISSTTYNPGAGGGANGGTSAVKGTPGVSRWGASAVCVGSGVAPGSVMPVNVGNLGTIDRTVDFYPACGPRGGNGGASSCANNYCYCNRLNPTQVGNTGMIVITQYQGTRALSAGKYNYVFTKCAIPTGIAFAVNCTTVSGSNLYTICIPIGTTSTEVRVLGGGSAGNQNCGLYTGNLYRSAGGGGGGYARSTYTTAVTATGVTLAIQISDAYPGSYNNSSVTIGGTLEARAYSATGARGGGVTNANYARNGVIRSGGNGGAGYQTSCSGTTRKGGAGGGAAWDGGAGGAGGATASGTPGGGGGGAANCSTVGGAGAVGASSQGGKGGDGGGVTGTGGAASYCVIGRVGTNGGGGAGGTSGGTGVSTGGAGGTLQYLATTNTAAVSIIMAPTGFYGPGGGGGGNYDSSSYNGTGGAGGLYGGGGGGGKTPASGAPGLVIVSFQICGALAAAYTTTGSNTVSQSNIIV